jgi:sugar lactone lactonase YvrE
MEVDQQGHIWIDATPTGESGIWTVIDPSGRWLGNVELPRTGELLAIGEDYLLVLTRDELQVESIHVLELVRDTA